jgi:hypothetical protein
MREAIAQKSFFTGATPQPFTTGNPDGTFLFLKKFQLYKLNLGIYIATTQPYVGRAKCYRSNTPDQTVNHKLLFVSFTAISGREDVENFVNVMPEQNVVVLPLLGLQPVTLGIPNEPKGLEGVRLPKSVFFCRH